MRVDSEQRKKVYTDRRIKSSLSQQITMNIRGFLTCEEQPWVSVHQKKERMMRAEERKE